jgi:hypothetical protein
MVTCLELNGDMSGTDSKWEFVKGKTCSTH